VAKKSTIPGGIKSLVHIFERTDLDSNITQTGANPVLGSFEFMFSKAPGYTELQVLFTSYKILKVKMEFFPIATQFSLTEEVAGSYVKQAILAVIDYNNSTVPGNIQEITERANIHKWQVGERYQLEFTPHILRMIYQSAIATSYESVPSSKVWLATANDSVPHYALKYGFVTTNLPNGTPLWTVWTTYTIACKLQA